jgi:hypothetical protein
VRASDEPNLLTVATRPASLLSCPYSRMRRIVHAGSGEQSAKGCEILLSFARLSSSACPDKDEKLDSREHTHGRCEPGPRVPARLKEVGSARRSHALQISD